VPLTEVNGFIKITSFSYKSIIINCSLLIKCFFVNYIYNTIYSILNENLGITYDN